MAEIVAGRLRQHFEGARLQRIAGEDGGGFIEGAMTGRAAASQIIVVHGRQVIVHQAVNMNEFDRGGGAIELFERRAERLTGRIDQHWPDAFATRQRAVTHGFEQSLGGTAVDFERACQHRFDALLVLRDSGRQETRRAGAQDFSARRRHRRPRRRLVVEKASMVSSPLRASSTSTFCCAVRSAAWH